MLAQSLFQSLISPMPVAPEADGAPARDGTDSAAFGGLLEQAMRPSGEATSPMILPAKHGQGTAEVPTTPVPPDGDAQTVKGDGRPRPEVLPPLPPRPETLPSVLERAGLRQKGGEVGPQTVPGPGEPPDLEGTTPILPQPKPMASAKDDGLRPEVLPRAVGPEQKIEPGGIAERTPQPPAPTVPGLAVDRPVHGNASALAESMGAPKAPSGARPELPVAAGEGSAEPQPATPAAGAVATKAASAVGTDPAGAAAARPAPEAAPRPALPTTDPARQETGAPSAGFESPTAAEAAPTTPTFTGAGLGLSRVTHQTLADLSAQIVKRLEGRSTRFEMALTPEDLGRVDVSLEVGEDGSLTARLAFDTPAAAAELRAQADQLRRQLEQAGFQLARDALEFSQRDGSSQRQDGFERRSGRAFAAARDLADRVEAAPIHLTLSLDPARDRVDVKV